MDGMNLNPTPNNSPVGSPEEGYGLSVADVIRIIWRRLAVILLVAVLLTGSAVGLSLAQTPVYEASTTIAIGERQEENSVDQPLQSEVDGLQALALSMATAVDSRRVAEATIQRLDLRVAPGDFVENLSAEQVAETPFVEVKYTDTSRERAKLIANTVAAVFEAQVSEVNVGTTGPVTVEVWERAVAANDPVSPNPLRNGFVALVLGLMLGLGLAFLLEYLDNSWRSPEEVEQISGVPTYAVIPRHELSGARPGATRALPPAHSISTLLERKASNGKEKQD